MDEIESLLARAVAGEAGAQDQLFAASYDELRLLARARLRRLPAAGDLNTTALVHETYLRIAPGAPLHTLHRRGFFMYASRVMRSVIVDTLREHACGRRGGDLQRLTLDARLGDELAEATPEQVLDIDAALQALAAEKPRLAQVAEMRFFAGHTEIEVAEALDVTERTVRRDWHKASLLLRAMLADS
jgi:RNA polymerase sigma factor (TIGR02999 family)